MGRWKARKGIRVGNASVSPSKGIEELNLKAKNQWYLTKFKNLKNYAERGASKKGPSVPILGSLALPRYPGPGPK